MFSRKHAQEKNYILSFFHLFILFLLNDFPFQKYRAKKGELFWFTGISVKLPSLLCAHNIFLTTFSGVEIEKNLL